jgi:hypothetical protein
LAVATDRPEVIWAAVSVLALALAIRIAERIQARRSEAARDSLSGPGDL